MIAGTLIVGLGGYGPAATLADLCFILGVVAAPFLPETNGKPLPETRSPALAGGGSARGRLSAPSRISNLTRSS